VKISPVKFWYVAVIVGAGLFSSTFAGMSLIIDSAQQVKPLTRVEMDDIREAVFRYQFYHNASGQQQRAKAYFLSLEEGHDPDDAFIDRFKDNQPPVKKISQVKTEGLFEKENGFRGLMFRIDSIKQISPDQVEVLGGYYESGLSASGNTYTVRRVKDKWTVTSDKMDWIS
jgi:hypothetical protein